MHYTDKDARDRHCPLGGGRTCSGHGCMAWRWSENFVPRAFASAESPLENDARPPGVPDTWTWAPAGTHFDEAGWVQPNEEAIEARKGFCGMVPPVRSTFDAFVTRNEP
jgi:hypothetical protein